MNELLQITFSTVCMIWSTYVQLLEEEETRARLARKRRFEQLLARNRVVNFFRFRELAQAPVSVKKKRKIWAENRSTEWWDDTVQNRFSDLDWVDTFRMSKSTFNFLCSRLNKYLQASDNAIRVPNTPEFKVAIMLYKLTSCSEYRAVAEKFGTNKSVVHKYVYQVCKAIYDEFRSEYLKMPVEDELMAINSGFKKMTRLPNIMGAVGRTHVAIMAPKDSGSNYFNNRGWRSMCVLVVVDHQSRFRYMMCKHPGSVSDEEVLLDSQLYQRSNDFIVSHPIEVGEDIVSQALLGDSGYPLLPWLLRGYDYDGILSQQEILFNNSLESCSVVQNAFVRLKSRFKCLAKRIDIQHSFVPNVVAACCILHNILESRNETFLQHWMESVSEGEVMFPQPEIEPIKSSSSLGAITQRDILKNYYFKSADESKLHKALTS